MYPKIKFKIDIKKDVDTLYCFIKEASFTKGRDLRWAVINRYPFFNKYKEGYSLKVKRDIVATFIGNVYRQNKDVTEKNLKIYEKNWGLKEKEFFQLVDELFDGRTWPKGKYIAYTTIWGMFPRFLDDKTFQLPFKFRNKKYVDVIIAHEMLHFMFYDYYLTRKKHLNEPEKAFFVWHISEIFNIIIQNSPEWLGIFEEKSRPYPEHKNIISKISKKHLKNNMSLDKLVDMIEKEVSIWTKTT